jgi:NADH:ubiquinone oxidoreductase subunit 6 (subunit J)
MSGLHGALGWLTVGAAVFVVVAAAATHLTWDRRAGRALALLTDVLVMFVTVLVFAAIFLGGLLLITGSRPEQMLHVIYGVGALVMLPLALAVGIWGDRGGGRSRRRYAWVTGGAIVLVVLALLLSQSG